MAKVNLELNPLYQSGYTYLQAVGSDGADRTIPGYQLRWDFLRTLGENHLAKGSYANVDTNIQSLNGPYPSTIGFNKNDDFVKIFRADCTKLRFLTQLNFATSILNQEMQTGATREWRYNEIPVSNFSTALQIKTKIAVRFIDIAQYDKIRATLSGPLSFAHIDTLLKAYNGIIEIEPLENKLAFHVQFKIRSEGNKDTSIRVETVSIPDTMDMATKQLSSRKKFTPANTPDCTPTILAENIQYVRYDYKAPPMEISFITYKDFILGVNKRELNGAWSYIGNFALTLDDTIKTNRLMPDDIDGSAVNQHWPKYNSGDPERGNPNPNIGEFFVNKDNYNDKWQIPYGLKDLVQTYLEKSMTDERAMVEFDSDSELNTAQKMSSLDLLRLVSLDHHFARILGLGHIDKAPGTSTEATFIYCLEYNTHIPLESPYNAQLTRTHLYLSLPTKRKDYRLPTKPILTDLTYGSTVKNGTDTPISLTDKDGYVPLANMRFVNLNRTIMNHEKPFGLFYYDTSEFNLSNETPPIGYGLEYRFFEPGQNPKPIFHKIKLSSDIDYLGNIGSKDKAGYPEIMTILAQGITDNIIPPLYTHLETEEGHHEYAAYGINWFSRTSELSNQKDTLTIFPKVSHLLPPSNFAVQLIQDEDPGVPVEDKVLIFTTSGEQDSLAAITSNDKTLVRISFDWNHIHHKAHQYADYAEFFFRRTEPMVVRGGILSVADLSENRARITTTSYKIESSKPVQEVTPFIAEGDEQKFKGSLFSAGDNNYEIESVERVDNKPVIIIKKIKNISAVKINKDQEKYISVVTYSAPKQGDIFFMRENVSAPANFDLRHSRRVYLERFYTNSKICIRHNTPLKTRVDYFDINDVVLKGSGTNVETKIDVQQKILFTQTENLFLEYQIKNKLQIISSNSISVAGDQTKDFKLNSTIWILGSNKSDGNYTVASSSFNSLDTIITLIATNFPTPFDQFGVVESTVQLDGSASPPEFSIHLSEYSFIIPSDKKAQVNAAKVEFKTIDQTSTRFVIGGIVDNVTLQPIYEKAPLPNPPLPTLSNPNPTFYVVKPTGYLQVYFESYNAENHIAHPEVEWNGGTLRLQVKDNPLASSNAFDLIQPFDVITIGDILSAQNNTPPHAHLALVIQDPGFNPNETLENMYSLDYSFNTSTPTPIQANFHPSYKLYIKEDKGLDPLAGNESVVHFEDNEILPNNTLPDERSKQTYLAIRSFDIKNTLASPLSHTVALIAIKYSPPIPPKTPKGPLYATRPDYQGVATYTFDTELNETASGARVPYSVVFYRSSEDRILDVLYRKTTQKKIWEDLNNLTDPKAKYDPNLWNKLFNAVNTGTFELYDTTAGQFTWPAPDNDGGNGMQAGIDKDIEQRRGGFIYPFEATKPPAKIVKPFLCDGDTGLPKFDITKDDYQVYDKVLEAKDILKKAILSVFLPLNEQPPIFSYIKGYPNDDIQTSPEKVNLRDSFGKLKGPNDNPPHGLFPMIKRLPPRENGNFRVRFTDYTLDGASKSLYFYFAMEMSDQLKLSEPGFPPLGPILLVNSMPAEKPQIRKVITQLQNSITNKSTAVLFEINQYLPNDKISKLDIYRAIDETDALTTRTMVRAKRFDFTSGSNVELIDDFSDLTFPAYGEKLYYRMVALREIEDVILKENTDPPPVKTYLAPSLPSDVVFATVVDTINPQAPHLYSEESGDSTLNDLKNVRLKWNSTCYNGTYYLQKLNSSGNWVQVYKVKVKNEAMQYPPLDVNNLPDFTNFPATALLPRIDEDGNNIYHRFRVQVENSSGLFNLTEYEVTLAKGASDLQEIDSVLSYDDGNGHSLPVLKSTDIITGTDNPRYMKFTYLNKPLPAGHKAFNQMEITVTDDLNQVTQWLLQPNEFPFTLDNISGFPLDFTDKNRIYTIKTKLFSDFAVNGAVQIFTINYLAGPCYDLKQINTILKLTDGTHDMNPLISSNINNGVAYPTQLKFTKIVDLTSILQTFNHIDITVSDDLNNTATKTIGTNDTDVTFTSADGLILDNSNPNRSYEIKAKLFTNECAAGNEIVYNISYTYTPCDDLVALTNIAKYTDNNTTVINPIANQNISSVTHPGGSITLQNLISNALPSGHTFDHLDVILEDDLGGASIKTIASSSTSVTFNHGDGNLLLDSSSIHRTYFITLVLYTNLCSNGSSYVFTIKY